jgi:hypothetical protein
MFHVPFAIKYYDYAEEVVAVSTSTALSTFSALQSFSKTITSLVDFAAMEWPLVSVPHFEQRGSDYLASNGADLIVFAPLVSEAKRILWEPFATEHQGWIQDGLNFLAKKEGRNDVATAIPIREDIWRQRNGMPVRDSSAGPYIPLWQTYPPPKDSSTNLNLVSHPTFNRLIDVAVSTRKAVLSETLENEIIYGVSNDQLDPTGVVLQPVFRDFSDDSEIVAFLGVVIPWGVYFQNVLYEGAHPIICVLKNKCGEHHAGAFTFRIEGPRAVFLGKGDLHSSEFDGMEVSSVFDDFHYNYTAHGLARHCDYSLHIYPSSEMKTEIKTAMPIIATIAVICVFAFTSFVFIIYDSMVNAQATRLKAQATRTTAIINTLFPTEVHDRLFGADVSAKSHSSRRGRRRSIGGSQAFHLTKYLSDESKTSSETESEPEPDKPKPIADLFPEATVMYALITIPCTARHVLVFLCLFLTFSGPSAFVSLFQVL